MNELINLGNGANVKVTMLKGEQGSSISTIAKTSTQGLVDTYTITLTDGSTKTFTVTNGKSISTIAKTDTTGLVDTYTITFNDATTTTFTVTNGKGISSIAKTTTVGLVDTYTITYNDETTSTFDVANGKGITSIAKTDTTGLVDTYTITYNDETTSTFTVTNGANGQDVAQSNLAKVEESSTSSQSYSIGQHLVYNGIYYIVIQAISLGGTFQVGVNIQPDTINNQLDMMKLFMFMGNWNTEYLVGTDDQGNPVYGYKTKWTKTLSANWGVGTASIKSSGVGNIVAYNLIIRESSIGNGMYNGYFWKSSQEWGGNLLCLNGYAEIAFNNNTNSQKKYSGEAVIFYTK